MHRFSRLTLLVTGAVFVSALSVPAGAADDQSLYQARTIVTGTGETNRKIGFRDCLDRVMVRVSGDQRLPDRPGMKALREQAGDYVDSYRYRDRLEGIPVHDEQGTHDRPHDLTCLYKPQVVDQLLARLDSKPWLGERPVVTVFLTAKQGERHFILTADGDRGQSMRESFLNAADPLSMHIAFPKAAQLAGLDEKAIDSEAPTKLEQLAEGHAQSTALAGSIVWSDKDLGWIAQWRMAAGGRAYRWQVRGVSFDEAFRVAIRGAAQILSGNGEP